MARPEVTPFGSCCLLCGVQAKVKASSTDTGMKRGFCIFLIKENDFFEHLSKNAVEYQRRICILVLPTKINRPVRNKTYQLP